MKDRRTEFERLVNGRPILEALAEYGPLSYLNLRTFTGISSHDRNFKRTISRLIDRKYITRMEEHFLHSYAVFYQINQSDENIESLAGLMNRDPILLKQKYVRMKELMHEQACAKLQFHLDRRFPEAIISRDWQKYKGIYDEVFLIKSKDNPKPDLLLKFPLKVTYEQNVNAHARIAVEYEKTRKTRKRLQAKLEEYAWGTYMDGMIWLVDDDDLADLIKMIYRYQIEPALRINYPEEFILVGRSGKTIEESLNNLHTVTGKKVKLEDWIHWLQSMRSHERGFRKSELRTIPCISPHQEKR